MTQPVPLSLQPQRQQLLPTVTISVTKWQLLGAPFGLCQFSNICVTNSFDQILLVEIPSHFCFLTGTWQTGFCLCPFHRRSAVRTQTIIRHLTDAFWAFPSLPIHYQYWSPLPNSTPLKAESCQPDWQAPQTLPLHPSLVVRVPGAMPSSASPRPPVLNQYLAIVLPPPQTTANMWLLQFWFIGKQEPHLDLQG